MEKKIDDNECGCCEQCYKDGFREGLNACKPSSKLDKMIAEGREM